MLVTWQAYLLSAIEQIPAQFLFTIVGVYADNGGEYVNHKVA